MDVRGGRQPVGKRWEDDDPFEDLYKGWRVDCDVRAGGEYMQRVILLAEEEIDQMCGLLLTTGDI